LVTASSDSLQRVFFSAAADLIPGSTGGGARENPSRSPFDFGGPGGFHLGGFGFRSNFKAVEKLYGDACPLLRIQLQGFVQDLFDLSHAFNFITAAGGN
jgi:hypothetical protein